MLSSPSTRSTGSIAPAHTRPTGSRVLIVEDNIDAARLLEILLRSRSHAVSVAHDGSSALRIAMAQHPAVMLIDIDLPDVSGYELARRIRAESTLQPVLLIAVTGYDEAAARAMTAASGFDHHLVKPLDREKLELLLGRISAEVPAPTGSFDARART